MNARDKRRRRRGKMIMKMRIGIKGVQKEVER